MTHKTLPGLSENSTMLPGTSLLRFYGGGDCCGQKSPQDQEEVLDVRVDLLSTGRQIPE